MSDKLVKIHVADLEKVGFEALLDQHGYVVVQGILNEKQIDTLKADLEAAIEKEATFHGTTDYKDYGMLLAAPIYGGAFIDVLENRQLMAPFNWVLGDTCIIYVYTSSSMPPNQANYSSRIHVDRPHFIPGYTEAMGCLMLLDDFTEENGATWLLPGSHKAPEAPSEEYFYKNGIRLVAQKGSVIYFHLRLWHAGGRNTTDKWRHAVGMGMIRPYLKQRIDLPKAMRNVDVSHLSEFALQKLGFLSQPPGSLEEYYAPPEQRSYKQRSEWDVSNSQ